MANIRGLHFHVWERVVAIWNASLKVSHSKLSWNIQDPPVASFLRSVLNRISSALQNIFCWTHFFRDSIQPVITCMKTATSHAQTSSIEELYNPVRAACPALCIHHTPAALERRRPSPSSGPSWGLISEKMWTLIKGKRQIILDRSWRVLWTNKQTNFRPVRLVHMLFPRGGATGRVSGFSER